MKVLIVSHLPVATQNNMGKTFLSLFSRFDKQELCQLYIYPAIPDVDRCSSYYRVTDKEVLSSLLTRKKIGSRIDPSRITQSQGLYEHEEDESFYRSRKNKSPLRRMLRDAMWAMSPWYGEALTRWLDQEKPECIFLAPGPAKFIYNIALKIAKRRNIPIVTYICDDYYFVKRPDSFLDRLRLKQLQRKIGELMERSAHLVVICDELKQVYSRKFGVDTTTLMTGTSYAIAEEPCLCRAPKAVSYFGNIRCERYRSLADVGRTLDGINADLGTDYRLKIYTAEKDPTILSAFDGIHAVELCGFVTGADFDRLFHEADLLLHVEAFDEKSIDLVKHSVSTKIADSLASGIPLLAYGPEEVASMRHLLCHGCAIAATSGETLRDMLVTAFTDESARRAAAENGLAAAREYHDSQRTGNRLKALLAHPAR